jgi:hypothetical protein
MYVQPIFALAGFRKRILLYDDRVLDDKLTIQIAVPKLKGEVAMSETKWKMNEYREPMLVLQLWRRWSVPRTLLNDLTHEMLHVPIQPVRSLPVT